MVVSREELEESLAELSRGVRDPRAGVFGPGSMTWTLSRESALFVGGGRAALLQTAHPFVAHGVDQHSATRHDPLGRFLRTFDHVFAMVFGDLAHALSSSRRVFAIHQRIVGRIEEDVGSFARGAPYAANTGEALLWVAATLWDTSGQCFELVVRPLGREEKERYYDECRRFARLFAIPPALLPPTWGDFRAWFEGRCASPDITAGAAANEIRGFLATPPSPALAPVWTLFVDATAGLLPPRIREDYGFRFGPREQRRFDRTMRALRLAYPRLPESVRTLPAYREAMARTSGRKPGLLVQTLTRAFQEAARRSRRGGQVVRAG